MQSSLTASSSVAKLAAYKVPLNDKSAQALYDAGVVSPHGRGNKTVYDASYRDAHEVKVCRDQKHPGS